MRLSASHDSPSDFPDACAAPVSGVWWFDSGGLVGQLRDLAAGAVQ